MRERDLLRQALESGKTQSRKSRTRVASGASSKANSAANSPAQSRAASRNPSRQVSDDEDYLSDGTAWSTTSIEEFLNGDDNGDIPEGAWKAELNTRVEQIINLKRSSTEGRADSLHAYAHILMARYAKDEIDLHVPELTTSMLRSIRQETTEREAVMALKALTVTIVTLDSDILYDDVADQLKRSMKSESVEVQVAAIHALGIAAFFGGAGDDEKLDVMAMLMEIIESDGDSVDAHDEAGVVVAALENWGLLATEIDDFEDEAETAAEAFVEQLESDDPGVQIAAGENIALLYEKSFRPQSDDDDSDEEDADNDPENTVHDPKMVKLYQVYRREDQLLNTLDELANVSSRQISKKDRKALHSSFADIRNSVEKPARGPGYSTAVDSMTNREYGAGRMKIKIGRTSELRIDKWWQLRRLNALQRTLRGGFTHHFDQNELVSSALPSATERGEKRSKSWNSKKEKKKLDLL